MSAAVSAVCEPLATTRAVDFGCDLPNPNPCGTSEHEVRQKVLLETLRAFEEASPTRRLHKLADENLRRWWEDAQAAGRGVVGSGRCMVSVLPGDWGAVTLDLTTKYGVKFAVLNMANAYGPGGAYTDGAPAQEENMFRRTDCHFSLHRGTTIRRGGGRFGAMEYAPAMTRLLNATPEGRVYLDTDSPRVCIRGPEDLDRDDLGYAFLPDDKVFPFYELRAAAVDLRGRKRGFKPDEARRRIAAQLDTLVAGGVRHAVLSAFGCGAFRNPANEVAYIYREEIEARAADLDVVAFAIFHPGYGPDNFTPFRRAFERYGEMNASQVSPSAVGSAVESGYDTPPPTKEKVGSD